MTDEKNPQANAATTNCYPASTLAESVTETVMMMLGFREPSQHPEWLKLVSRVQCCIGKEIDAMGRVAIQDAIWRQRERWSFIANLVVIFLGFVIGLVSIWLLVRG